ncbi:hypothetical protein I4J31_12900 [Corynebacterium belfantii]|uniref:hypothetical protein n=1 Tax=Corynebacterium belfantii TaxID=2014537 RepID=UPI0018D36329|nr:hypothetical protein [Corynebacterium belfantii]MBG9311462.1 hypothetical protein [Corynebacterium belfantii]
MAWLGLAGIGWDWLALVGVGGRWWALVGAPPPLTPEKDGTSHQIRPNGRFSCDLV